MRVLTLWQHYLVPFLQGLGVTLEITGLSLLLAVVFGAVLTACRLSHWRILRLLATVYVDIMRATPVLVILFLVYFGLGQVGIQFSGFWAAVLGLGCFYASLFAEIFRGGVLGVDRGQGEAADALGLSPSLRLRKVTLPQAFMAILLPSTNTVADLIKDTSLVLVIGVADLMAHANQATADTFKPMDMFVYAGLFYFALYLLISRVLARWEYRVQRLRY